MSRATSFREDLTHFEKAAMVNFEEIFQNSPLTLLKVIRLWGSGDRDQFMMKFRFIYTDPHESEFVFSILNGRQYASC